MNKQVEDENQLLHTLAASQPKTGCTLHFSALRSTPVPGGKMRTTFPGKPPPVMCAAAFTFPD